MTLTIAELEAQLRQVERPPYGFFVSQAIHDGMIARWRDGSSPAASPLAPPPPSYAGMRLAIDPDLPDAEFLVAQTERAWREHLTAINSRKNSRTEHPYLANALEFRGKSGPG